MATESLSRTDRSPTRKSAPVYRERNSGTATPVTPRTPKTPATSTTEYNSEDYWDGLIDIPPSDWLFTMDDLKNTTPSRRLLDERKRLKMQDEIQKRCKGMFYMFNCCRQLRLSRSVALTGSYFFHRFYMKRDMVTYHYFEIAAASLFIACKSEECRRRLGDVVKVCSKIAFQGNVTEVIDEDSKIYWKWKDLLTRLEELLLEELCFEVTPENPYKICLDVLKLNDDTLESLSDEWTLNSKGIFTHCCNFLEISSRVPLILLHDIRTVCALGVIIGAEKEQTVLPTGFLEGDLNCSVDEVWKCFQEFVELGRLLTPLDSHFHVLNDIPKLNREKFEKVANST